MSIEKLPHKIQIELVKLLFQQIKVVLWSESIAAISLTIALWKAQNHQLLISWLLFNLLFCGLARHVMLYFYNQSRAKSELTYREARTWLIIFAIGAFLSGISWGASSSILMVENDTMRQTFEVFLIIGVTAAANPVYSPYRSVYIIFLLPAFIPFVVWLSLQGSVFIILSLLAVVFMVIMLASSFHTYKLIYKALELGFENLDLIENLSQAKKTLEIRSEELEKSLSLLYKQAHYDLLTGLPNRILVQRRISQAILYAKRRKLLVAVLFMDLDRFKMINDTLGHLIGDQLLKLVALRLASIIKPNDTISRVGGDEFLIILTSLTHKNEAIETARLCLQLFNEPFLIENNKFNMSISIGISFYPEDGVDAEKLIRNADIAMYRAKEIGSNAFLCFTEDLNKKVQNRLIIENQLRDALYHHELSVLYQPIVSLKTGRIIGAEALMRWEHPTLGSIAPSEFISVAEESGIIISIGEWILKTACKQIKQWHEEGYKHLSISVNLSARQFKQIHLFDQIHSILSQTQLHPKYLALELTESVIMDDIEENIKLLKQLKKIGVMLSIDDFGIGYSSLNYLKQLPVDKLKIDISFIKDIALHTDGAAITAAIIALAFKLHLKVLAEGVENEEQLAFLVDHHCDEMQGFYFSPPLNVFTYTELLRKNPVLALPATVVTP